MADIPWLPSGKRIADLYTIDEIKAKIASHEYSPGLLLQHAMQHLERLAERDAQWFAFAVAVGERLRCLPSSFPDANAHILRVLDAAIEGARNVST